MRRQLGAWGAAMLCIATLAAQEQKVPPTRDLFPLAVGNRWVLRDQSTGTVTTFEVAGRGNFACRRGVYDLHITKDNPAGYWSPGKAEAIHYYLEVQRDGSIVSPGAWSYDYTTGKPRLTINTRASRRGTPPTNLILKPDARDGEVIKTQSRYLVRASARDAKCLKADPPRVEAWAPSTWTTKFTFEDVDTPAYTGRALCARYAEGSGKAQPSDAEGENNAEQWCFALDKPLGLVQLTNLHNHFAGVSYDDPPMVLKLERVKLKPVGKLN